MTTLSATIINGKIGYGPVEPQQDLVITKLPPNQTTFREKQFLRCTFSELDLTDIYFIECTFTYCDFVDCVFSERTFQRLCVFDNTIVFGDVRPCLFQRVAFSSARLAFRDIWEKEQYTKEELGVVQVALEAGIFDGSKPYGKTPNMHGIVAALRADVGAMGKMNWFPHFIESMFETIELRDYSRIDIRYMEAIPLGDTPKNNTFAQSLVLWIIEYTQEKYRA